MTIKEVGEKFELSADTLRYYERIGLIPKVERTAGGIRNYSEMDCRWVYFIKCMRRTGVAISALVEYVTLFHQGDSTKDERRSILAKERDRIAAQVAELTATLDYLNVKIDRYDNVIVPAENLLIASDSAGKMRSADSVAF